MKTLVAALITALLVFTLATAWIEVVQPRLDLIAAVSQTNGTVSKTTTKRVSRRMASIEAEFDEDDGEFVNAPAARVTVKSTRRQSKPSREDESLSDKSKERILAQLADVKQQESRLIAREDMLRMLYEDIRLELAAVEDIRRRSATELAIAERKVLEAAVNKTNLSSLPAENATEPLSSAKSKPTEEARIAGVIEDLAQKGYVVAAASLLSGLKDRDAAKVLTSLSSRDPRLALQLTQQVQAAKQELLRR